MDLEVLLAFLGGCCFGTAFGIILMVSHRLDEIKQDLETAYKKLKGSRPKAAN